MKQYKNKLTVRFGYLEWTTSNLNTTNFSNGDLIPLVATHDELVKYLENKQPCCHYLDFNEHNKYLGILYNEFAIKDPRCLGMDGFRVPTEDEWKQTFHIAGYLFEVDENHLWDSTFDYNEIRRKNNLNALKSLKDSKAWKSGNHKGNNKSGFSALPTNPELTACSWATMNYIDNSTGAVHMGSIYSSNKRIDVAFRTLSHNYLGKSFLPTGFVRLVKECNQIGLPDMEFEGKIWENSFIEKDFIVNNPLFAYIEDERKWGEAKKACKAAFCYYNGQIEEQVPLINWYALQELSNLLPSNLQIAHSDDFISLYNTLVDEGDFSKLLDIFFWNSYFHHFTPAEIEGNKNNFGIKPLGGRILKYVTHWDGEALYDYVYSGKGTVAKFWTADSCIATFLIEDDIFNLRIQPVKSNSVHTAMGLPVKVLKLI
jgi:uncharacterized protein (TIGR02145 family)